MTNIANILTMSRIAAIPLIAALLFFDQPLLRWAAFALYAIACITDFFDGYIARRMAQVSALGRFLDPIADKLLVGVTLFMLAALGRISAPAILPALVILAREILVSGLREHLATLRVRLPVSRLAKWKTGIQMAAIVVLLIGDAGPAALSLRFIGEGLLWVAAALTLVTGYDYLRAGLVHINDDAPAIKTAKPSRAT